MMNRHITSTLKFWKSIKTTLSMLKKRYLFLTLLCNIKLIVSRLLQLIQLSLLCITLLVSVKRTLMVLPVTLPHTVVCS